MAGKGFISAQIKVIIHDVLIKTKDLGNELQLKSRLIKRHTDIALSRSERGKSVYLFIDLYAKPSSHQHTTADRPSGPTLPLWLRQTPTPSDVLINRQPHSKLYFADFLNIVFVSSCCLPFLHRRCSMELERERKAAEAA